MKAKEIMRKYQISSSTLSQWIKKGLVKVKELPSGRLKYTETTNITKNDNKEM